MADQDALRQDLLEGYSFAKGDGPEPSAALFGRPLTGDLEGVLPDVPIRLPLRMFNRHGLIAGATGTGKTKTLQLFAEQLSEQGVPVFLADLKGDLTGLADPAPQGDVEGFLTERMETMGFQVGPTTDDRTPVDAPDASNEPPLWRPRGFPVDLLSLTGKDGHQIRVPLREFGPLLLAKVMDCSEVQESVLQVVWQLARDKEMALVTIDDLDDVLRFVTSDEGEPLQDEYGGMSTQTINVLRRKLVELEGQGADRFFGEPGFDVTTLWEPREGEPFGIISILRLVDVQARPRIFSTFLMWLLSAVYANADELGDPDRPKLVFFFDEAHLLFEGASKSLLELVELTVRMIRSKGIGVFFVTQQPTDLPDDVLAQLGTRVQHALRAFTPNDQKALKATAQTYPVTDHYDVRETLTGLGIGEALLVGLGRKGAPTPTAATRLVGPRSSMDPVDDARLADLVAASTERLAGAEVAAPTPSPDTAEDLMTAAAPTPAVAAATDAVTAGPGELFRALSHRCALVRPAAPVKRTARAVRTAVPGASPMRRDLTKEVVAVQGGLGELSLTETELRFASAAGAFTIPRGDIDELQWLHGLLVVGSEAFLLDPDDQLELLGAFDSAWGGEDLASLSMPPDDLLDELAALDDEAVAAATSAARPAGAPGAAPPPVASERIDAPAPEAPAADEPKAEKKGRSKKQDEDKGGGVLDAAASPAAEEVAATVGKMLGINKGTTRSLFRAFRKGRR